MLLLNLDELPPLLFQLSTPSRKLSAKGLDLFDLGREFQFHVGEGLSKPVEFTAERNE